MERNDRLQIDSTGWESVDRILERHEELKREREQLKKRIKAFRAREQKRRSLSLIEILFGLDKR